MKKLLSLIALAGLCLSVQAQTLMSLTTLTNDAVTSVLTTSAVIDNIYISNATTNAATIKFYDASTASSNIVRVAYTSWARYATNIDVVITNGAGFIYTNTFTGTATLPTSVSAVTNEAPVVLTVIVPANSVLNKDVRLLLLHGLSVLPTQSAQLVTTYRRTY